MKKLNLTQWIFIALILGIAFGAWLNVSYPPTPSLSKAEAWEKIVLQAKESNGVSGIDLKTIAKDSSLSPEQKYDAALKWANEKKVDLKEVVVSSAPRLS